MCGQVGEAFGQAGLAEEHMLGFFDAFVDREIDVVVLPRMGAALVVPVDLGVLEKGGFRHGWFAGDEWQVASGKWQVASRKSQVASG